MRKNKKLRKKIKGVIKECEYQRKNREEQLNRKEENRKENGKQKTETRCNYSIYYNKSN